MLFQTIALSVITLLLFLLLLSRNPGRIKALLGALTAAAAVVSLVLFLLMRHAAGGAEAGKELFQLYVPCGLYLLLGLWGLISMVLNLWKLKKSAEQEPGRK